MPESSSREEPFVEGWLENDGDASAATVGSAAPAIGSAIESVASRSLDGYDRLATPVWIYDPGNGRIDWANRAAIAFWQERDRSDLRRRPLGATEVFGDHAADYRERLREGRVFDGVWSTTIRGEEVVALCRFTPVRFAGGSVQAWTEVVAWRRCGSKGSLEPGDQGSSDESCDRGRLRLLLEGQNEILQLIAKGAELEVTLERIALFVARFFDPRLCAVQWLDDDSRFCRNIVAPVALGSELRRWPAQEPDAHEPCPDGAQEVMVRARTSAALEAICRSLNVAVAWSTEIRGEASHSLGLITLLESRPEPLDDDGRRVLGAMMQLAGFAIENDRHKLALRSANERMLSLASMIPGVVYQRVVRPDGDIRYTYISEGARELFGVAPEEVLANPQALFDRHGPDYYATFRERLMAASRALAIWDVEAEIIDRDGNRKFTHAIARPQRQPDGSVVWNGVILDQTRIKEAEKAAAAAEARTRDAIIEGIPQGLALYDADDRLITWNRKFLSLYPQLGDLIRHGAIYAEVVEAEVRRGLDRAVAAPTEGHQGTGDECPQARIDERMALHRTDGHVLERRLADGRWILVNEQRTADGGTVILHTDVTEFKDRETALTRTNRELEAFVTIASHDLQEPLRKIDAFGDRLEQKYRGQLDELGQVYLDRMRSSAVRLRSLINDLLGYTRITTDATQRVQVDLGKVADEAIAHLRASIEAAGARVEVGDLPTVEGDPRQMRTLLENLLSNAIKFHPPDRPPTVRVSARRQGHEGRDDREPGRPGDWAIEIADDGIGFDLKYLDRIFTIFQRLHAPEDYAGTGVGLATCRKIVEGHGGTITARSTPGEGSTFLVTLPATAPLG